MVKRVSWSSCLAAAILSAHATEPAGYYASAEGKAGAALHAALHQIIRSHRVIPYSDSGFDTGDALRELDQSPDDPSAVRLVYSGIDAPKTELNGTTGWNREHLWPNTFGLDSSEAAHSDLHNLRACDATVNSVRGNSVFDEANPGAADYFLPGHAEAPGTARNGTTVWEPREIEKGDIARAMFYMDVCYEGDANDVDLRLTDALQTITNTNANFGRLTTLVEWHLLDPVDEAERQRNDLIYQIHQVNRNPFVDRPEWVEAVFGNPLKLTLRLGAGSVVLAWPASLRRAALDRSDDLASWQPVVGNPIVSGGDATFTESSAASRQFYRLVVR